MSNAEQVRRPHPDARAFAEAFTAADDAFAFAPSPGVSRTMTLSELQSALALEGPVQLHPGRAQHDAPTSLVSIPPHARDEDDDGLLSLDELGAALARPAAASTEDGLDFDFGSGTRERARRRTAARFGRPDPGVSRTLRLVPASDTTVVRVLDEEDAWSEAPPVPAPARAPRPDRRAVAPAASLDESWFGPAAPAPAVREDGGMPSRMLAALPAALRPAPAVASPQPLTVPVHAAATDPPPARQRERSLLAGLAARPDRIALWAVVLGILLVVIAASSSSQAAVRAHAAAGARPAVAQVQHVAASTAALRLR